MAGEEPQSRRRASLVPGDVVGQRYQILAEVASGAFGTVYRAKHVHTLRVVALKVLHAHTSLDEAARERFRREVCAPTLIGHPGVVEVLDADIDQEGAPFVAMEWLDGETLRATLAEGRPLTVALDLVEQLLDALAAVHEAGFVHRDLKPENVFVTREPDGKERAHILDLGLARRKDSVSVTSTGTALGTPRYMSPEQFMSAKHVGPPADVWAVGVMLYELVSGEAPFLGASSHALMLQIITTAHTPVLESAPSVPAPLAALIDRCLAKEAGDRPRDARALLNELGAVRALLGDAEAAATIREMPSIQLADTFPRPGALTAETVPARPMASSSPGVARTVVSREVSAAVTAAALSSAQAPVAPRSSSKLPWIVAGVLGVGGLFAAGALALLFFVFEGERELAVETVPAPEPQQEPVAPEDRGSPIEPVAPPEGLATPSPPSAEPHSAAVTSTRPAAANERPPRTRSRPVQDGEEVDAPPPPPPPERSGEEDPLAPLTAPLRELEPALSGLGD